MSRPASDPQRRATPASTLFLIRASFLMSVMLFGGITYYLRRSGSAPPMRGDDAVDWIPLGIWALVAAGLMFFSGRYRAAQGQDERVSLAIVGWALGEMAGLAGAAHYFLTGEPRRFGVGLVIFVMALLLFPIPRDDDAGARR